MNKNSRLTLEENFGTFQKGKTSYPNDNLLNY